MIESAATERCIEETTRAYIECALWASTDDAGEPLDGLYSADDLAGETREKMAADVVDFLNLLWREGLDLGPIEPEQIGHDFWLTRNGHGAGFWDRGLGDLGETLTRLAHPYGESTLYIGDDGMIYVGP